MKYKASFVIIIVMMVLFSFGLFAGCTESAVFEEGDFVFQKSSNDKCNLIGITDAGKEKEILYIPAVASGRTVVSIGKDNIGAEPTVPKSVNVRKIILPNAHINLVKSFTDMPNLEILVYSYETDVIQHLTFEKFHSTVRNKIKIYVPKESLDNYRPNSPSYNLPEAANISFLWNFEDSLGRYYYADYCEVDSLLSIPPNPVREGYAFSGWSTNESGNDLWNFNTPLEKEKLSLYAVWD